MLNHFFNFILTYAIEAALAPSNKINIENFINFFYFELASLLYINSIFYLSVFYLNITKATILERIK
jgi:hypothetical protein